MHVGIAERRALIVLASVTLHVVVLGWLAWRHERARSNAETPVLDVQIVRLRPAPETAPVSAPSGSRGGSRAQTAPAADLPALNLPTPAAPPRQGVAVDPRWAVDLNGPVFEDGKWPRPRRDPLARRKCDPWADPDKMSPACRRELSVARTVTRNADPQNGDDDLAREARHKEAMRAYHDAPGTSGYPGLRCALLHRC